MNCFLHVGAGCPDIRDIVNVDDRRWTNRNLVEEYAMAFATKTSAVRFNPKSCLERLVEPRLEVAGTARSLSSDTEPVEAH